MENSPALKAEALEIMKKISALRREKEEAIARSDFEAAAYLLKALDDETSRLQGFQFPPYVLKNILRGTHAPGCQVFPILDMLELKPVAKDAAIPQQWPKSLASPIHLALTSDSESPAGELQTLLEVNDIFSRHFRALLPVLCVETFRQFKSDMLGEVMPCLFREISRCIEHEQPLVLSVLDPSAFLNNELQEQLVQGLKEVRCDFVIFANGPVSEQFAQALRPEIVLAS